MTRVLIAAAVPILWMILANSGRTRAVAGDITSPDTVRRPPRHSAPGVRPPDVRLTQVDPVQPAGELLSFRNPFAFAPRSLPPGPPPVTIAPPPPPPPGTPSSVALSLIGVATTSRAGGSAERTAIIAGPTDALHFVREGDAVMTRYRVEAVLQDSVLLVDGATGASLCLPLR